MMRKKITLVGGSGTIGTVLYNGLSSKYDIVILDKKKPEQTAEFIQTDAADYEDLVENIPKDTDVLVNLLTIKTDNDLENLKEFHMMTSIHFIASFYILHAADSLGIPKVVFASSNHAADYYEKDGYSSLGREITPQDFPISIGLYGVLKYASEGIGRIMARNENNRLSVINLRIGSVLPDEKEAVKEDDRLHRTLLSHEDAVQLFDLAIQSTVKNGTYYGVSDNADKPWSTETAWKELGFVSKKNAQQVLKENRE
ncbi:MULTISPECIES: NAD(P)-dependent oxidoreductase [Bacillus]|uniref:NAD-dependent epimerase/dehydratase family protein n=1 Tax=Bacillus TaxID=1386 RepID=UPI001CD1E40C|nr:MULTISPECIES: NAD(P)-dependent oxidoreductase [Bacillus]MCA1036680.1 NAD(P)-dependent oxidoreductase [Bacillus infantis]